MNFNKYKIIELPISSMHMTINLPTTAFGNLLIKGLKDSVKKGTTDLRKQIMMTSQQWLKDKQP